MLIHNYSYAKINRNKNTRNTVEYIYFIGIKKTSRYRDVFGGSDEIRTRGTVTRTTV